MKNSSLHVLKLHCIMKIKLNKSSLYVKKKSGDVHMYLIQIVQ